MQTAGYRAKLTKDATGDPLISSATNGYNFDIFFYGCTDNRACDSLHFQLNLAADARFTPASVAKFSADTRFVNAYLTDTRTLRLDHDVTTIGGLNSTNFTDVIAWWEAIVGAVYKTWPAPAPPR